MPLAIGAVLLLAALFGRVEFDAPFAAARTHGAGALLLFAFGAIFLFVMSVYSAWYLLDSLYADRKDRSILFWKSLPVSDTETVLSKLATGLIVIPLVYFAAADLTTLIIAFIVSLRASTWFGVSLWQSRNMASAASPVDLLDRHDRDLVPAGRRVAAAGFRLGAGGRPCCGRSCRRSPWSGRKRCSSARM